MDYDSDPFLGKEQRLNEEVFRILALNGPMSAAEMRSKLGNKHTVEVWQERVNDLTRTGWLEVLERRASKYNPNVQVPISTLSSKGWFAAAFKEPNIDFAKYSRQNFFSAFATFLTSKGAQYSTVKDWIIEGVRQTISKGLVDMKRVREDGSFAIFCSQLSSTTKLETLLIGLSREESSKLQSVLSAQDAGYFRARVPRIMAEIYKVRASGVPSRSCYHCGIELPAPGQKIGSGVGRGKFCGIQCYLAFYNPALRTTNKRKCSQKDCPNFVYVTPGHLKRKPNARHFCKKHAHKRRNINEVPCACGCGTMLELSDRQIKRTKLGKNFYADHWNAYLSKNIHSDPNLTPLLESRKKSLEKNRVKLAKLWQEHRVPVKCSYCGRAFQLSKSRFDRNKEKLFVCKECHAAGKTVRGLKEFRDQMSAVNKEYLREHPEEIERRRKPQSEEVRRKHSESMKKYWEQDSDRRESMKGKKLSKEIPKKMSRSSKRVRRVRDKKSGRFVRPPSKTTTTIS